ncbi:acetylxylan esterase [Termitidicoccus mucosus]|uniref:Acetylxylan esterase n=1 Tax=Termitidicoccus mucosus TaxID=1184151 RepID=A0A178IB30_9BACT|nr:acetylxylan esterase [Opitutaceae bacterium TSB47]
MKKLPALLTAGLAIVASAAFAAPAASPVQPVPAFAQARLATVQVVVAPDHADWTYATGQPAKFTISVLADNNPLAGATVSYKVGPEQMPPAVEKTGVAVPAGGLVVDAGTLKEPGLIRCIVTATVGGKTYRGLATAAFSPEKIQPTQAQPDDFDAFWDAGKAELATVPMEPTRTLLPEYCTSDVNVYHVSFRVIGGDSRYTSRIYGILCEPKAPGSYPAILRVPGAGVRPYVPVSTELASRGVITLNIGIHGIPVDLPAYAYDQMRTGALKAYWAYNLDDKDAYYYRRVYLGCVRANDYLLSLPNHDGKNLLVTGGSQGGQLSLVTAGLDPRVTAVAPVYPAYCDVTGYLHGRAGGWPHMFRPDSKTGTAGFHAQNPAKIATTAYYDAVNFARRIKAPGLYSWGYNDETCPPTSMFAAYNVIKAPKALNLALITGHNTIPEENVAIDEWLLERAGVKK